MGFRLVIRPDFRGMEEVKWKDRGLQSAQNKLADYLRLRSGQESPRSLPPPLYIYDMLEPLTEPKADASTEGAVSLASPCVPKFACKFSPLSEFISLYRSHQWLADDDSRERLIRHLIDGDRRMYQSWQGLAPCCASLSALLTGLAKLDLESDVLAGLDSLRWFYAAGRKLQNLSLCPASSAPEWTSRLHDNAFQMAAEVLQEGFERLSSEDLAYLARPQEAYLNPLAPRDMQDRLLSLSPLGAGISLSHHDLGRAVLLSRIAFFTLANCTYGTWQRKIERSLSWSHDRLEPSEHNRILLRSLNACDRTRFKLLDLPGGELHVAALREFQQIYQELRRQDAATRPIVTLLQSGSRIIALARLLNREQRFPGLDSELDLTRRYKNYCRRAEGVQSGILESRGCTSRENRARLDWLAERCRQQAVEIRSCLD